MIKKIIYAISTIVITPFTAFADLPLTVEDLLTSENRYRLEFSFNYANSDRRNVASRFDLIQTGTGQFVLLPVDVGEERRNSDFLATTLGGRYGLTKDIEILTRLTGTADDVRIKKGNETDSRSGQRLSDWVIGINHQFSPDNDTPALLGFVEITAAENTSFDSSDFVYGKTGQIGFTSYRTIDPLVLSMTAGYRYAGKRKVNNQTINPGDLLFINPSVGFAVNNEITLTGGVQLKFRGKDRVDGSSQGIRTSQTDLEFGVGYSASKRMTLNFTARADMSGDTGAQVGFNLLYKFGKLTKLEDK